MSAWVQHHIWKKRKLHLDSHFNLVQVVCCSATTTRCDIKSHSETSKNKNVFFLKKTFNLHDGWNLITYSNFPCSLLLLVCLYNIIPAASSSRLIPTCKFVSFNINFFSFIHWHESGLELSIMFCSASCKEGNLTLQQCAETRRKSLPTAMYEM